ncbi:G-protein coupled receptor 151 [Clarias gariepinus]|uniref:G-protein coupled receptor 151 n=1 Tax=Clarias gariepinus TaxID=13013 RepID=UPI00234C80CB|nr:G-protein coupled receptor 151 [Clarias gariepinus]
MDKLQDANASAPNGSLNRRAFLEKAAYQHLQQADLKVLVPVGLGVISVLGFIANATAVGVLVGNARKSKLSLINALILNLLLADALLLALAVPFKATAYSREAWTLGLVVCKTGDWFVHACMAAKSLTVAIMAKACYRYVSNPTKQVTIRLKTIVVVLLFTWLLACVLPLPHWLFTSLEKEDGGMLCVLEVPQEAREFMSVYVKAYPLLAFCAPLSFALLYFWRAHGRCQRRCSKTQNLRAQIRSRKLTLMLFGLAVTMATMWLPHWVAWVWMRHAADSDGPVPPVLFAVAAQFIMFSISLANPLIVLALSEEFREGYKGLWRRLTLRKHAPKQQPKPGPHAPTAPRSPTPRPEASAHLPPRNTDESRADKQQQQQQDEEEGTGESPGNGNKDGVVPPDVEQFWHEREGGSMSHENDPVPWEHQDPKEGKQ